MEPVSLLRFIPVAKHSGIRARTNTDDLAANFSEAQAAIEDVGGGQLIVPRGRYHSEGGIFLGDGVSMIGEGKGTELVPVASAEYFIDGEGKTDFELERFFINLAGVTGAPDRIIFIEDAIRPNLEKLLILGNPLDEIAQIIWADNAQNMHVERVSIYSILGEGLRAANSRHTKLERCHFEAIEKPAAFLSRAIILGGSNYYSVDCCTFKDIGTAGFASINDVCCIDVGGAENGAVTGCVAENVHSFIDIETSIVGTPHEITVTGNQATGLRKLVPAAYGKGLFINGPDHLTSVIFSSNSMSYFSAGLTTTAAAHVVANGNSFNNCESAMYMASTRKLSVVGGTIKACVNGIEITQSAGFGGGVLAGICMDEISSVALSHTLNSGTPVEADRLLIRDMKIMSGTISYSSYNAVNERGNSGPSQALPANAATATLVGSSDWYTANTGATAYTDFDLAYGEEKTIIVNDNFTSVTFNNAGGGIYGNLGINATVGVPKNSTMKVKRLFDNGSVRVTIQ
ncbi:MAG: right-handed parallel beta-helix repeat-containing protein [Stagnimonas sp.]|nr:right-handed parallel beta-helix repeat-containing protein [Stagnimonas sp.]